MPEGRYDAVLVSSSKGIECAGASADALKSLPLHVVGAKTAKVAASYGWRPDIVEGNAASILPLLLARYPAPARFLYLAGRDRQPTLEAGLLGAGHEVTAVDVYEARAAASLSQEARAAIAAGDIDIALHYSRRSVEIFLTLLEAAALTDHLADMAHVALSDEVAAPLRVRGLEVACAEKPDEAHLLQAASALIG